jgi:hypothetical protein
MVVIGNRNGDEKVRAERFNAVRSFAGTKALIQSVPDFEAQKLAGAIQSALAQQGKWNVQVINGIPPERIDDGVGIFTAEEKLFAEPGQHQLTPDNSLISAAGRAAASLAMLLELDLGPPYGPPLGGVAWTPQPLLIAKSVLKIDIPEDTVLILVGMKPITWAFVWPVTPPTPTNTEK